MMPLELILLLIGGQFTVTTGELFETQFYCLYSGTAILIQDMHTSTLAGREQFLLSKLF